MTKNASQGSSEECSEIKSQVPPALMTSRFPVPLLNLAHRTLLDLLFRLLHPIALNLGLRHIQIKIFRPCEDRGKKILPRSHDLTYLNGPRAFGLCIPNRCKD